MLADAAEGNGAASVRGWALYCLSPMGRGGPRSGSVRGQDGVLSVLPPHPNPLPVGERERSTAQFFGGGFEGVYCALGSLLVRSQPASPSQYGLMSSQTFGKEIE